MESNNSNNNNELISYRLEVVEEQIKEIKSDLDETKKDIIYIRNNSANMETVIKRIDSTIEENKKKWSTNINGWLVGGIATAITTFVTYVINNFLNSH